MAAPTKKRSAAVLLAATHHVFTRRLRVSDMSVKQATEKTMHNKQVRMRRAFAMQTHITDYCTTEEGNVSTKNQPA